MTNAIRIQAASLVSTSMVGADQWHASEIVAPLALERSRARTTMLSLTVPPGGPYRVDAGAAVESWSNHRRQVLRLRIGSGAWHEFVIDAGEVSAPTLHAVLPASIQHRTISLTIEWSLALPEIVEMLARARGFWRERWQAVSVDDAGDDGRKYKPSFEGPEIGRAARIGGGAVIMPGCKTGENSVLGAGSILTSGKEIPAREVWFGYPAIHRGKVEEDEIL